MDPVDRTFDAVYYWSQRAKRAAQSVAETVATTTTGVADSIASTVSSITPSTGTTGSIGSSPHSGLWSLNPTGLLRLASENRVATAATVITLLGLSGYALDLYPTHGLTNKVRRKAEKLPNGARKDVVLIVGSVVEPLTRYVANDLEARGFFVYITSTNSKADQKFFQNESLQDIKSLIISADGTDDEFNAEQIRKFDFLLSSDHIPFQGAEPNKLNLVGIVFIPDMFYPSGKFHMIPSLTWSKTVNGSILTPLSLLKNGLIGMAEKYDSNIIFVTPTISSSLSIPCHSLENITSHFLQQLSTSLANDFEALNITNLKLGAINVNTNNNRKNYGIRGESLRSLFYKIFDLLYAEDNSAVEYVGVGARFLSLFGAWVPRWLMRNYFRNYFAHE